MKKTSIYIFAGILLGLIFHLILILTFPKIIPNNIWSAFAKISSAGELISIESPKAMKPNILRLDPELTYAFCRYDLSIGPGFLSGELPNDFWSIGVFNKSGISIYSTTHRSAGGQSINLGIFNPSQTRLLAENKIELQKDILIVKAPSNEIFIVIRLAVPYPQIEQRYKNALKKLRCSQIETKSLS